MTKRRATVTGKVTHIFAHRFVVETSEGPMLSDLTPHGAEKYVLNVGDQVELDGELKPSELKVSRLTCKGKSTTIGEPHKKDHPFVEPAVAREAARQAGFEAIGEPRRKPKHFEVLGRKNGEFCELHIELNGKLRKTKSVIDEDKWADAMRSA